MDLGIFHYVHTTRTANGLDRSLHVIPCPTQLIRIFSDEELITFVLLFSEVGN